MSLEKSKSMESNLQTLGVDEEKVLEATNKSFCQKVKIIFTNITVEPLLMFYILPSIMSSLATQNLNLEKACRVNLRMNESICDAMVIRNNSAYNKSDEIAVQQLVSTFMGVKNIFTSVTPTVVLLLLGSWSDRHKRRKPCMILPLLGDVVSYLCIIVCVIFMMELPLEFAVLSESIPAALTGSWFAMTVGVYSYISSISSVETRTLRIGAVSIFSNISMTVGVALSGVLYKKLGFYGVYCTALCLFSIGLLYCVFFVKEVRSTEEEAKVKEIVEEKGFCRDFFNFSSIIDTLKVAFKEGKNNRKKRILTIMVLVMIIIGPIHGEMNVVYMFVRFKFQWNEMDYSMYATCNFIAHFFGTMFSLMFFSKFLKLDDAILGMISTSSKIAGALLYAFAPTGFVFYCGILLEIVNGTSFIAMRSIMSKLVPPEELGQINSLFAVCEGLVPLLYGPMYSMLYNATIDYFPGAFYLLGGGLMVPSVFIFFWLYTENKKDALQREADEKEQEEFLKKEQGKNESYNGNGQEKA